MKVKSVILFLFCSLLLSAQQTNTVVIPVRNNAWPANAKNENTRWLYSQGMKSWNSPKDVIRTYFYIQEACTQEVAIEIHSKQTSVLKVKVAKKTFKVNTGENPVISLGQISFPSAGYYYVDVQGVSRKDDSFGELKNVLVKGNASVVKHISEDTHFGRRGPSVHMVYTIPKEASETEWYYSEIEVPKGQDVIGSYFMANGFGEGYFGMQVNSPTERRVLFSVWSPFTTDDPNSIPDDHKIVLLRKGEKVNTGEFGNEGSGGQSYMRFPWKAGKRYGFLLRGKPMGDHTTTYTAWFFDPEQKEWMLIASFSRPQTTTYLKRFYSFLENFIPNQGSIARQAFYCNQWVADSHGKWFPITEATFTYDATAHAQRRFDYAGGVSSKGFFLKMGGFFNKNTKYRTTFPFKGKKQIPKINFVDFE